MSDKIQPDYRAKRIDNGEWEFGFRYIDGRGKCYIIQRTMMWRQSDGQNEFKGFLNDWITEVDPATLCRNTTAKIRGVIVWQHSFVRDNGTVYEVLWDEENYRWYGKNHNNGFCVSMAYIVKHCDFAGNRHDNPERLVNE